MANPPAPDVEAKADYPSIWLEPACDGCSERTWCSEDAWGKCDECGRLPTRYVRADLHEGALTAHTASLQARVEELERENGELTKDVTWSDRQRQFLVRSLNAAEAEASQLREALERSLEALRPFAARPVSVTGRQYR